MHVNTLVLVQNGEVEIGYFKGNIEMPCLPPIGTHIQFGQPGDILSQTVERISYSEAEQTFTLHFVIDIEVDQQVLGDYIPEDFYPNRLLTLGFTQI